MRDVAIGMVGEGAKNDEARFRWIKMGKAPPEF